MVFDPKQIRDGGREGGALKSLTLKVFYERMLRGWWMDFRVRSLVPNYINRQDVFIGLPGLMIVKYGADGMMCLLLGRCRWWTCIHFLFI